MSPTLSALGGLLFSALVISMFLGSAGGVLVARKQRGIEFTTLSAITVLGLTWVGYLVSAALAILLLGHNTALGASIGGFLICCVLTVGGVADIRHSHSAKPR